MTAFGDAFKAARAAGKTTFKFNGKSYHTKTKDEMEKVKAKAAAVKQPPVPTPRPPIDSLAREDRTDTTASKATQFQQAVEATTGSRPASISIPAKRDSDAPAKQETKPIERRASGPGGKSAALVNRKVGPWQWPHSKPRRVRGGKAG